MDINPSLDVLLVNIFSHFVCCFFIWLITFFAVQNLFSLIKSHLFYFSFVSFAWGDISNKKLLWAMFKILPPMFSSMIFMVSGLTFKSLIYFEFILVCGLRRQHSFIFLHESVQFSQHHLLNKLSLAHCMFLPLLSNTGWL